MLCLKLFLIFLKKNKKYFLIIFRKIMVSKKHLNLYSSTYLIFFQMFTIVKAYLNPICHPLLETMEQTYSQTGCRIFYTGCQRNTTEIDRTPQIFEICVF